MDFELTEEQKMLKTNARDFLEREKPIADNALTSIATEDFMQAVRSFVERREPTFRGR